MRWEGGDGGDERGDSTAHVGAEFLSILLEIAVSLGGQLAGWEVESGCAEVQWHHSSIEVLGGARWGHEFHGVADIGRLIVQAGGGEVGRKGAPQLYLQLCGHYINTGGSWFLKHPPDSFNKAQ